MADTYFRGTVVGDLSRRAEGIQYNGANLATVQKWWRDKTGDQPVPSPSANDWFITHGLLNHKNDLRHRTDAQKVAEYTNVQTWVTS